MRKEADPMQEERIIDDPGIQGVLVELRPHHSLVYSTRKAHLSEESQSNPKVSPIRHQRIR